MKAALFWGSDFFNWQEEPIIFEDIYNEVEKNQLCENLLKEYLNLHKEHYKEWKCPILPGHFWFIEGEEDELKGTTIKTFLKIPEKHKRKVFIINSVGFFTDRYDPEKHRFNNTSLDNDVIGAAGGWSKGTARISLRLESGLVKGLRDLGKKGIGEFLNLRVSDFILRKYFRIGKFRSIVALPFNFGFNGTRNLIIVREVGLCIDDVDEIFKQFKYKEDEKKPILVDFRIDNSLLAAMKILSQKDGFTLTTLFKEAIIGF